MKTINIPLYQTLYEDIKEKIVNNNNVELIQKIGKKAYALIELIDMGITVPDGFSITSDAQLSVVKL